MTSIHVSYYAGIYTGMYHQQVWGDMVLTQWGPPRCAADVENLRAAVVERVRESYPRCESAVIIAWNMMEQS